MPATLKSAARLLLSVVPEEPAAPNSRASPATGGLFPPVQFKSAQLGDALPCQVSVAATTYCGTNAMIARTAKATMRRETMVNPDAELPETCAREAPMRGIIEVSHLARVVV